MTSDTAAPPRSRTCLVLGGARSGKSRYAQHLVESTGRPPTYVATATVWDDAMRERVAAHRRDRDGRWRTVEEPLALIDTLQKIAASGSIILVDCLTLWLTNLMLGDHPYEAEIEALAATLPKIPASVVLVSNEVGCGIVPDTPLGRRFRDAQGRLNQVVAGCCDTVVLVAAGLPVQLKPAIQPAVVL